MAFHASWCVTRAATQKQLSWWLHENGGLNTNAEGEENRCAQRRRTTRETATHPVPTGRLPQRDNQRCIVSRLRLTRLWRIGPSLSSREWPGGGWARKRALARGDRRLVSLVGVADGRKFSVPPLGPAPTRRWERRWPSAGRRCDVYLMYTTRYSHSGRVSRHSKQGDSI